jgi:DNA repair exonuclease SbcCD ATPase subunit
MSAELQERVSQICNDLYGKAEKVSVRAVLSLIPDVSSTSTVHKYVKVWRDELQANQQSLMDRLGFSEKFTQSFLEEFSRFNTEAEKRWRETAEQAKEQAREAVEDLERIEDKYHKQQALLEQSQKAVKQLEDESRENEKSQRRIEAELRERIAHLEGEKYALTENNDSLRTEVAKLQIKVENSERYVSEVRANRQKMAIDIQEANEKIAKHTATIVELKTNAKRDVKQIEELRSSTTDYRRLMEESEKRAGKLEESNKKLEALVTATKDKSETSLLAMKSEIDKLAKDIAEKDRRISQQEKVIDKLTASTEK